MTEATVQTQEQEVEMIEITSGTKESFKQVIAAELDITKKQAGEVYDLVFGLVEDLVKDGIPVRLPGIGTLHMVELPAGEARNPQTGEAVQVGERLKIKLRSKPFAIGVDAE